MAITQGDLEPFIRPLAQVRPISCLYWRSPPETKKLLRLFKNRLCNSPSGLSSQKSCSSRAPSSIWQLQIAKAFHLIIPLQSLWPGREKLFSAFSAKAPPGRELVTGFPRVGLALDLYTASQILRASQGEGWVKLSHTKLKGRCNVEAWTPFLSYKKIPFALFVKLF